MIPASPDSFLDLVAEISFRLTGADDDALDGVIDDALSAIGHHEGAHRAYLTLAQDGGRFTNTHEWVADGVASHREAIVDRAWEEFPYSSHKLANGEVWHCPDVKTLPPEANPERQSFSAFGVVSVLQVPMRNGGKLVGALGFNHVGTPRTWTNDNIDHLRRISDAIGFALLRREASRSVAAALSAAERANRAKSVLLASVSHELRTPLHAILGFAELVDGPHLTADERAALSQIVSSGQHLLGLVEQLLHAADQVDAVQPPME